MKRGWWILKFIVFGLAMLVLIGLVTQLLWNWLVPVLFAGPVLTFWQALGLLALTKILFWSFGKGGGHSGRHWGGYWKQKWHAMSTEDKERFRKKMYDKWCPAEKKESNQDSGTSNV